MDKIYGYYNQQASEKFCMKNYFEEYSKLLQSSICYKKDQPMEEKMFQLMGVELSKPRLDLMSHYCSVSNLRTADTDDQESGSRKQNKLLGNIPDNVNLETLKELKKCNVSILHKCLTKHGIPVIHEKLHKVETVVTPHVDFLVYVQVYEPFNSSYQRNGRYVKYNLPILRSKCVISLLGSQCLTALREKITCLSDSSIAVEVSENPDAELKDVAKDVYKSGFFFIEDTFYNDMRDAKNIDYSEVIITWAATRNKLGPFKTAKMEDVRIDSLCARFGYPWVYVHQGSCEHLIVLSDVRLVHEEDDLSISSYPKIERIKPTAGKNCSMCGLLNVRWIVLEHDRIPHDTSYFCENCFRSYNYVDGKKVGNFKAYRYPCIPTLLQKKD